MAEDKRRQFRLVEPQLTIEKTEAINGNWVTSGHVSIDVLRGDDFSLGKLVLPFVDAGSRAAAIDQAMLQLRLVCEAIAKHIEHEEKPAGVVANEAA